MEISEGKISAKTAKKLNRKIQKESKWLLEDKPRDISGFGKANIKQELNSRFMRVEQVNEK